MTPVHISAKHKAVIVPWHEAVKNLFPTAKELDLGGKPHLVVPHAPAESFMLRRLDFDVPAPILSHYEWPHPPGKPPFDVQKKTAALLTNHKRAYVLNGMGTGKTKASLWSWDYLRGNGLAKKLLVVAPLSTLKFTWEREIFHLFPTLRVAILHGTKEKRLKMLASDADIYVINHDGPGMMMDALLARKDIDTIIIDELAVYRNARTIRTKAMRKLVHTMQWAWGMTGSPIPRSPTDAFAQAQMLSPERCPRSFTLFRDEVMTKVTNFKWVPRHDATERAFNILQPAVRFTLDDVVELPDCVERFIDVALSSEQEKVYKALAAHYLAMHNGEELKAANAAAVMQKLLQVACGWVYRADGTTVTLDNNLRITALADCIESTDNKVLVFVPFKHALAGISKELTTLGYDHAVVSGDTPMRQRNDVFTAFQQTDKYRIIAAHPQCVAHGITLTAADTIVWYAPVTSLEIYDQANHRIRRVGQKNKQQILHLQSTPVERRIYKILQSNQAIQTQLLELFEAATEGMDIK